MKRISPAIISMLLGAAAIFSLMTACDTFDSWIDVGRTEMPYGYYYDYYGPMPPPPPPPNYNPWPPSLSPGFQSNKPSPSTPSGRINPGRR